MAVHGGPLDSVRPLPYDAARMNAFLGVLFRWLHIVPAAIVIGGVFVMRVVLPIGLMALDNPEQRHAVFLRCRRVFKMTMHTCILLLLISGLYNTWSNWDAYKVTVPWSHAFGDPHVILGVTVMVLAIVALAGKEPPKSHKTLMAVNLALLMFVVLAAGLTKWVREHPATFGGHNAPPPPPAGRR
jgi:uncharacterized membrane protein